MIRSLILILIFTFPFQLFARVDIPTHLSVDDRIKVLEILGPGTSSKILTDPYPLGGFAGLEAGIQMDSIPVSDLSNLGDTVQKQALFNYPTISIGKGVYKDVDFFIHFIPSSVGTGISEYGGILRWGFYQMAYLPVSFALNVSADSANINNQLITKNFEYDLTAGITTQSIYFYAGVGQLQSSGRFSGGTPEGITDTGNTEYQKITSMHYLTGVGFRIDNIFLTTQMDYHQQPTYSVKLGFRY
jgi:hypothetical protein